MFVYGVACSCVYDKPLQICPLHKSSLVVYNQKQCANPTCKAGARGFCDACKARIIAIVKRATPLTERNFYKLVASLGAFLPQSAVNNLKHPYTVFVYTLITKIIHNSAVFTVQDDTIHLTVTVIEKQLSSHPIEFIANPNISEARWSEFLRETQKYTIVGKTVRRKTKLNCYNLDRLIHVLQNADYEGISLNDLYREHSKMNQLLQQVPHYKANRRVYFYKKPHSRRHHFV